MATTPFSRFAPLLFLAVVPPTDAALAPNACQGGGAQPLAQPLAWAIAPPPRDGATRRGAHDASLMTVPEWAAHVSAFSARRVGFEPERVAAASGPLSPWSRIEALAHTTVAEKLADR